MKIKIKNTKYYITHWFFHLSIATIIILLINLYQTNKKILNLALFYFGVILIDIDHLPTFLKFGIKGIEVASRVRVNHFFHNLYFIVFLALLSIISYNYINKNLGFWLLAPLSNILYDFLEDMIIFKVSYKKWLTMKPVDKKTLERIIRELEEK